ncbi:hypothetical protein ACRRVA_02095 [Candidatus Cardinium hertigii]|uniref:hypothetical protein n=1 Tax=Candidatus Cardinium hertigii TaxID=247481 RepID=UPI003D7D7860
MKQGIDRDFNKWFLDRVNLIVDFLEKDYIGYANSAFFYILKVGVRPRFTRNNKKFNTQLKQIAISVAERLIQEASV